MIRSFEEILRKAQARGPKTIAVAVAQDYEVLQAVCHAREKKIAEAILVGDVPEIQRIAQSHQLSVDGFRLVHEPDNGLACRTAVRMVSGGEAQLLMKGLVDTSVILKAVLDKEIGLRTMNVLSHVAVAEIEGYDRLFYITDAAMNIAPVVSEKKQIIENAVQVARALGNRKPNVACLGAVEKVNPKMAATVDALELVRMNQYGDLTGCTVAGPLALDNAVSAEAARHKGISDPVAGNADILLVPFIEAGNMLYKSIVFFARGKVGGIVVGAKAPVVLTSRADSDIAKLNSIAIGVLMA